MTELRTRMDPSTSRGTGNDMLVRGMAERTREAYLAAVARLARHYRRAPDRLSPQEVQAYLVHMLRTRGRCSGISDTGSGRRRQFIWRGERFLSIVALRALLAHASPTCKTSSFEIYPRGFAGCLGQVERAGSETKAPRGLLTQTTQAYGVPGGGGETRAG
jgi:hypothetical protein